jgi:hypothetical protein
MSFDWGGMAGGVQDALEQLLQKRILEEKMALAQRQQAAEEQHRAAVLGEQQAGRQQQGQQFDRTFGHTERVYNEGAPLRDVNLRGAELGNETKGFDLGRAKGDAAIQDELGADPKLGSVIKGVRAGLRAPGADDPTGERGEAESQRERDFRASEGGKNRAATITAAGIRGAGMGGTRPMTQGQRAALATGLRKDYNANVKGARTIATQVQMMNEAWKNYDVNPNAASQGILVTFQKILDPDSVVRESEYARSFDGQSLMDRMRGAVDNKLVGGAGIPKEQLVGFKEVAERFAAGYAQKAQDYQGVIDANAEEFGIDPQLLYSGGEFDTPEPTTEGGGGPAVGTERMINGVPAVWDGKGWKRK